MLGVRAGARQPRPHEADARDRRRDGHPDGSRTPARIPTRSRPVRSAGPAVATAGGTVSAGALDGFDWRGTMLLVGLAILGLLFVTDWLPALLAYSSL